MAKKKKQKDRTESQQNGFESVEFNRHFYILVFIAIGLIYLAFSYLSSGLYQDDEIGHFMGAQRFWDEPASILSYWSRPGFKLVYAFPALIGIKAVHVTSVLLTVFACWFTFLIAREYRLRNPFLSVIFCGLQPLLLQLSFRTYAEILAVFLISVMLWSYLRKKYVLCALVATYLFTVRQEYAVLAVIMGGYFLYKRQFLPFLLLGASPIILAVVGWLHSGHALWLFEDYLPIGRYANTPKPGFFHYWRMFEPIFGTITAVLFVVGYFSFVPKKAKLKEHFTRYHPLYVTFTVIFIIQCLLTSKFVTSPSPGHFRYLVPLAPVVALFANIGFNQIWTAEKSQRNFSFILFLLVALMVVMTLSWQHNYYSFTQKEDMSKLLVLAAFGMAVLLVFTTRRSGRLLVIATAILVTAHTLYSEAPLKKSPEHQTVEQLEKWCRKQGYGNRAILINHAVFYFSLGVPKRKNDPQLPGLYLRTLAGTPVGSIAIWDSHYSYRPNYKMDVKLDFFKGNSDYKFIKQFFSADNRYTAIIFEKVK